MVEALARRQATAPGSTKFQFLLRGDASTRYYIWRLHKVKVGGRGCQWGECGGGGGGVCVGGWGELRLQRPWHSTAQDSTVLCCCQVDDGAAAGACAAQGWRHAAGDAHSAPLRSLDVHCSRSLQVDAWACTAQA